MRGERSDGPEQTMLRMNRTVLTEGMDGSEPQGHTKRQRERMLSLILILLASNYLWSFFFCNDALPKQYAKQSCQ